MKLSELLESVSFGAAIRRVRRLQPVGGPGDKIFPPTYPAAGRNQPPRHLVEERRIGGAPVPCVLCDSAASQANRMEEALEAAQRDGRLTVPTIIMDFAGTDAADVGTISVLEAPHRVYDAIMRDGLLDGQPFQSSNVGVSLVQASVRDVTALYRHAPTALVFGAWNSTGGGGGMGAKFARAVVSEIVGINALAGARVGSRIDPLGIRAGVPVAKATDGGWRLLDDGAKPTKGEKVVKPSEINHGNIAPSVEDGLGVTVDYALQTWVLSLASLRRLRFGSATTESAVHGRAVLAALAVVALFEFDAAGYALRSRCDFVPDTDAPEGQRGELQIVHADGQATTIQLTREDAYHLLADAVAAATERGLPWHTEPVRLAPDPRLVELVMRSRALALAGRGEDDAAGE